MSDAPATVKFADPELLRRIGADFNGIPQTQSQETTDTFAFREESEPSNEAFTFQPQQPEAPRKPVAQMPQDIPGIGPSPTPRALPELGKQQAAQAQSGQAPSEASSFDSSSPGFTMAYANLSAKQRDIVDRMAESFRMADLFSKRRFALEWTIVPKQLKIGMQSLTTEEMASFWESLSELKGSTPYIDAVVAKEFCTRSIFSINGQQIPAEKRTELIGGFDFTLIQIMFDYLKLFETARMRFLHQADLVKNPISASS